jgi:hypothetical protein
MSLIGEVIWGADRCGGTVEEPNAQDLFYACIESQNINGKIHGPLPSL